MPQQSYPGQSRFRIGEEVQKANHKANTRMRMAKLRQNQSQQQMNRIILLQIQRRQHQRQQQYNSTCIAEQQMAQIASEKYGILY